MGLARCKNVLLLGRRMATGLRTSHSGTIPVRQQPAANAPFPAGRIQTCLRSFQAIIQKGIELSLQGDTRALSICWDRLLPAQKERAIELPLPSITDVQSVSAALASVVTAVGEGRITPGEALQTHLVALLETGSPGIAAGAGEDIGWAASDHPDGSDSCPVR
jgi:hypothetical protein